MVECLHYAFDLIMLHMLQVDSAIAPEQCLGSVLLATQEEILCDAATVQQIAYVQRTADVQREQEVLNRVSGF